MNLHQDRPHSVVHVPVRSATQQLSEAALSQDHRVLLVVRVRVLTPHRGGGRVPHPGEGRGGRERESAREQESENGDCGREMKRERLIR